MVAAVSPHQKVGPYATGSGTAFSAGLARSSELVRYSFQTLAALPATISSRSSAETSLNILSTMACECGQLDTGCG